MRILYVTDLHGDKDKYEKTLQIAIDENIKVIVYIMKSFAFSIDYKLIRKNPGNETHFN